VEQNLYTFRKSGAKTYTLLEKVEQKLWTFFLKGRFVPYSD